MLAFLNIADNGIGNEGLRALAEGLTAQFNHLLSLDISNNDLQSHSLAQLEPVVCKGELQELLVSSNKLTDRACFDLRDILQRTHSRLTKIDLGNCEIGHEGAGAIFDAFRGNAFMRSLSLERNNLAGANFREVAPFLKGAKAPQFLNLSHCNLSDAESEFLAAGLQLNRTLETLLLHNNYILVGGASGIAEALASNTRTRLKVLDVSTNYAQNEGGLALVRALERNRTLQQFMLRNNSLTDPVGDEMLAMLKKNFVL